MEWGLTVPAKYRKKLCYCYWLTLLQISLLSLKVVQGKQLAMLSHVDPAKKNIPRFVLSISLFPLPCFYSLAPQSDSFLQVICLSPTFDLARQTGSVLETMLKFATEIRMVYALRGERGGVYLFTGLDHWTGLLDWTTGLTWISSAHAQ